MMKHQQKIGNAFYDINSFFDSLAQLDEVFGSVRRGLREDDDFKKHYKESEADKILEELGAVEVVSKSESGKMFYKDLAKQIDHIFPDVLKRKGGAMSLIDVYLYYNRLRGSDLITCNDLLLASQELRMMNSKLELREISGGLKILQLRS
jgi:hypothetical protein